MLALCPAALIEALHFRLVVLARFHPAIFLNRKDFEDEHGVKPCSAMTAFYFCFPFPDLIGDVHHLAIFVELPVIALAVVVNDLQHRRFFSGLRLEPDRQFFDFVVFFIHGLLSLQTGHGSPRRISAGVRLNSHPAS